MGRGVKACSPWMAPDGAKYFWRVDPIIDGKAIPGQTWSFWMRIQPESLGVDAIVFVKRKPYSSDPNTSLMNFSFA